MLEAIPCPLGKIRDNVGGTSVSDCSNAPGGQYADTPGSTSALITDNLCLPGYMCPAGSKSAKEKACQPGSYQSAPGQDSCDLCPAGSYCPYQTVWPIPCPAGYYCYGGNADPTHQDNFPYPCAKGTYGSLIGLTDPSQCESCPAGFYCAEEGADSPTGLCDAGFICVGGDDNPQPVGGECPAGGYCERGS